MFGFACVGVSAVLSAKEGTKTSVFFSRSLAKFWRERLLHLFCFGYNLQNCLVFKTILTGFKCKHSVFIFGYHYLLFVVTWLRRYDVVEFKYFTCSYEN